MPDFLYTENSAFAGCEEDSECASYCEPDFNCVPKCFNEECSCINCEIKCEWDLGTTKNLSPQPLLGTGEWTAKTQIPIGEVIERSAFLGAKMLGEFQGIIENSKIMTEKTDEILDDYKNWNCKNSCKTDCNKSYYITEGSKQEEEDWRCPEEASNVPRNIYAGDECKENVTNCKKCKDCGERCCWQETYCWDSEIIPCPSELEKIEILTCKYCLKGLSTPAAKDYCDEMCDTRSCSGCCGQYFDPIIDAYSALENLPELLKNDIEEKTPGGEEIPKESKFKYKRSYILDQLEFSRCQLAQCWIPAEDWYKCFEGEIVCSRLIMAKTASQLGLFDDDQFISLVLQVIDEEEITKEIWGELWETPESWWQIPLFPFKFFGKIIILSWKTIWDITEEWFETGKEDACYPTNYYCCEL